METIKIWIISLLTGGITLACQTKAEEVKTAENPTAEIPYDIMAEVAMTNEQSSPKYKKGDNVPRDLVCMVNDAYMGKKQLEVPMGGKMYYGCCEMCKERIPKDEKVRYGIDPLTTKKVDKAEAYIVLVGDNGEVAYFEKESNYKKFVAENKQ